ncbi:hypothetical protein GX645_04710 [Candidatus Sumerlaeota bacterium]|nr:calcineurin-like phosphoesterase family protein [Candidatus Sumerlaeales bacterium]NLD61733.1 hypothetical protein [Candidatus Sumerlaeota bacterium]
MTIIRQLTIATLVLCSACCANASITGVVFEDANANGIKDEGEKGIAGVMVSDQKTVVLSDKEGYYQLPDADNVIIFVTTPADYMVSLDKDTAVPQFYKRIHLKDNGLFKANKAKTNGNDFALIKRDNTSDTFKVCLHSDPQTASEKHIDYYRADVIDEMAGKDYDFMVTLGDISNEALDLFPKIARAQALAGIPNYGVIGNNDCDYDATTREQSSASYQKTYGPDYYSFDRGKAHFVALNTVFFNNDKSGYREGIDEGQLAWLKADLANVPKDKILVLMMHVPFIPFTAGDEFVNKQKLFDLLEDREGPILAWGGHWHLNTSRHITEKDGWKGKADFNMVIVPTVCGSWWSGSYDYRGVPVTDQVDGTPNGYMEWAFDGNKYTCKFKPSALSDDMQARIYTPEMRVSELGTTMVLANFFMAPEDGKVEMALDKEEWVPMEKAENVIDPYIISLYHEPYSNGPGWRMPLPCPHMWKAEIPEKLKGLHQVRVRATMPDGRKCIQARSFKK